MSGRFLLVGLTLLAAAVSANPPARVPVLVELFTSEGCSSCPPADAALAELERTQAVPEAEIVPLSLHVDYWNRLGWRDPFSSERYSARQSDYARAFGSERIYTPQMVVDGRTEFVGSDTRRARSVVAEAAHAAKGRVILAFEAPAPGGDGFPLRVTVSGLPAIAAGETADVLLAVTEDRLSTQVSRGENAGRKLDHIGVVRELGSLGAVAPGRPFEAHAVVTPRTGWRRDALNAVVFVQERQSRRVLAVARLRLGV